MRAFAVVLLLFCGCKPSSKGQSRQDDLHNIVKREIGEKAVITNNHSKTFELAYLEEDGVTHYIIIRISDNKVVAKEKIRGTVGWMSDMQILESNTPGIVKRDAKPEDYSKVIDLNKYLIQVK